MKTVLFFTSQTILWCMCRSNCWVRPRGLQKIVYFNWGSTCRKFWEPLSYIIITSVQKTLESTTAKLYVAKRYKIAQQKRSHDIFFCTIM